jgi:hypothetical protein
MRSYFLAFIVSIACALSACDSITGPGAEARDVAQQYWDKYLTTCGDRYFAYENHLPMTPNHLYELKGPTFSIQSYDLSEANRLNGYQWSGLMEMNCTATRTYWDTEWTAWGSCGRVGLRRILFKSNDHWYAQQSEMGLPPPAFPVESFSPKRVNCGDVPK